jgi:prepilin-type N-terminal cleavage/methylation domain-containing protein
MAAICPRVSKAFTPLKTSRETRLIGIKGALSQRGFTLIEVVLAIAILSVMALGSLNYQYYAVKHVQIARAQMVATRITQMLLEDWKSTGGDSGYNPTAIGMGFTGTFRTITPDGSSVTYNITQDSIPMSVALSSANVVEGATTLPLRQITVIVRWRRDFGSGTIGSSDPSLQYTTYVRIDI